MPMDDLDESIEFDRVLFGFKPGNVIVRKVIGDGECFVPVGDTNLELLQMLCCAVSTLDAELSKT